MRTKILGLLTSLALLGGGAALAGQQSSQSQESEFGTGSQQQPGQSGIGGAGQAGQQGQQGQQGQMGGMMGQQGQAQQQNQVLGRVVKGERNEFYVEQPNGAVVQLKVDRNTKFADPAVKSPKDLRQGQELSINIERKGTDNFATRISPAEPGMMQGYGGAGQQGTVNQPAFPSPSGVRRSDQGGIQTPEEPGTGGGGEVGIVPEENPNVGRSPTENEPGRIGTGEESGGQGGIRSQGSQGNKGSQSGDQSGTGGASDDGTKGY